MLPYQVAGHVLLTDTPVEFHSNSKETGMSFIPKGLTSEGVALTGEDSNTILFIGE